ncbi:MAG: DUF4258 domain-containing protein [Anaerolineales bacterium]|nr:DUF4258 domain-containing protein [Anaerolineales bacterium]
MSSPEPILEFVFTAHALKEMTRRNIAEQEVQDVLAKPEQMEIVRDGRAVYQNKYIFTKTSKTYILRVFVDIDIKPPHVVTVYRTSKIEKYWR